MDIYYGQHVRAMDLGIILKTLPAIGIQVCAIGRKTSFKINRLLKQ
jgi:hypothetical protein